MDIKWVTAMKSKITNKLIAINTLLVTVSLVVFCIVVSLIFRNYMYQDIKKQLLAENAVATRLSSLSDENGQPKMFSVLSDSINLIYQKNDAQYDLIAVNDKSFIPPQSFDVFKDARDGKVFEIKIDEQNYLCTISTGAALAARDKIRPIPPRAKASDSLVVSLLSTKNINSVIGRFVVALILCTLGLAVISILITSWVSKRITNPIVKISTLTKQYANREFDEKYIANTGDELEELSVSINHMAQSLKAHDYERSKLFRHLSHELKTPLTAIYGYAEGIKTGVFKDTDKPLDIIMSESLRIKKLTEDIVFLSKLESSVEAFKFEKTDITSVIEDAIKSIESIAILNDIDIIYQPKQLPKANIDADKIFRALVNLLSNCLKYTKDRVIIDISQRKNRIEITIEDNGDGFDSESINNLVNGITKEKSDGSGIGLSIVNEIIKAHDGTFTIKNTPHGGAMFKVVL
jgi:two-component system, OmpR family, sensor histidine kinase CssS